ncbi:MAG TPA: Pycsar system effector family protein [Flavisolibacter sp.]
MEIPAFSSKTIERAGYRPLTDSVRQFVKTFMHDHQNINLLYHNLHHTEKVADAAKEIAKHYRLNDRDTFIVLTAAWFHDLGYYINIGSHRQAGADKAVEFLRRAGVDDATIMAVRQCILATKIPQKPGNLLEQIVCDADLFYFGTDHFPEQNVLMLREIEATNHVFISPEDWRDCTISLLNNHQYHTEYCRELLTKKKKQHLDRLRKKPKEADASDNPIQMLVQQHLHQQQFGDTRKVSDRERTSQTMFRITSTVSQRLSEQADTKAHILISVNAIIISVILTVMARRMETFSYQSIPIIIFLLINLMTITFSILATRPAVPPGTFNPDDIKTRKVNLLFFGNFYRMGFDEYSKGMFQMLGDRNYLYSSLIKNLYEQGKVLGRKYRRLKVAYNIFMYGIIVSVITFIIANFFL